MLGPGGNPIIAEISYSNDPGNSLIPAIIVGGGARSAIFPGPPPGMYQFTIARSAAQFQFYLDGNLLATFPDAFGTPAAGVRFFFLGPVSEPLGAFHIDRVQVVPTPGLLVIALPLWLACACGRTRRSVTTNQGA